jgi:hypothetical protein
LPTKKNPATAIHAQKARKPASKLAANPHRDEAEDEKQHERQKQASRRDFIHAIPIHTKNFYHARSKIHPLIWIFQST